MKDKSLLFTLAAAAFTGLAVLATSAAGSPAAVGYVNLSIPAGRSILGNPLDNGTNHLDQFLPLGSDAIGMLLFRYDSEGRTFRPALTFAGPGIGWVKADDFTKTPDELFIIHPGEGFFVQSLRPVHVTFVGTASLITLPMRICANNRLFLLANPLPSPLFLNQIIAGCHGDLAFLWDQPNQRFADGVAYVSSFGWVDINTFTPINGGAGPLVPAAQGFFIQRQLCPCCPCCGRGNSLIFTADFDGDTPGSPPPAMGSYGPPGASLDYSGDPNTVLVVNSAALSSRALKVARGAVHLETRVSAVVGNDGHAPYSSGVHYFEFRAQGAVIPSFSGAGTQISVRDDNGRAALVVKLYDGAYHHVVGGADVRLSGSYNPGLPHKVHITVDLNARTYTICINDLRVAADKPLLNSAFQNLESLRFSAAPPILEAFPSEYVVDNIQVTR